MKVSIEKNVLIGLEMLRRDPKFYDYSLTKAIKGYYDTIESLNTRKEWQDGKHFGDCTNEPETCYRCWIEEFDAVIEQYINAKENCEGIND